MKRRSMSVGRKKATAADRRYRPLSFLRRPGSLGAAVAARELLNTTGRVDELLFSGEKRMASGADADSNIRARRTGVIGRTARADDIGFLIIRMDTRLHGNKRAGTLRTEGKVRKL